MKRYRSSLIVLICLFASQSLHASSGWSLVQIPEGSQEELCRKHCPKNEELGTPDACTRKTEIGIVNYHHGKSNSELFICGEMKTLKKNGANLDSMDPGYASSGKIVSKKGSHELFSANWFPVEDYKLSLKDSEIIIHSTYSKFNSPRRIRVWKQTDGFEFKATDDFCEIDEKYVPKKFPTQLYKKYIGSKDFGDPKVEREFQDLVEQLSHLALSGNSQARKSLESLEGSPGLDASFSEIFSADLEEVRTLKKCKVVK